MPIADSEHGWLKARKEGGKEFYAMSDAEKAQVLDETGRPLPTKAQSPAAVPEGALVHVHERRDGRARVEWGVIDGWVDATQIRMLVTKAGGAD